MTQDTGQSKSVIGCLTALDKNIHESEVNLQKMNYLKETYNQVALLQSEMKRKSARGLRNKVKTESQVTS